MRRASLIAALGLAALVVAVAFASGRDAEPPVPLAVVPAAAPHARTAPALENLAAYIPVQCYARTKRAGRPARNSCATCHQDSREPNYIDDAAVQIELSIPRFAAVNHWSNALSPPRPVAIDDGALLAWIRGDNRRLLAGAPGSDCAFAPDADGWDRDAAGVRTGWRAYAYAPMPGMFWPTNGSMGDAFIRLPLAFRRDALGAPSDSIYALNLAILEAMIRRADVSIAPTAEAPLGVDLDADGRLGIAKRAAFVWPPRKERPLHYVGEAATLDPSTAGWPAAGLYPVGTEIVHSLRYLDVVDSKVRPAARMKELRYQRKLRWLSYGTLDLAAKVEQREKELDPDTLRAIHGDGEHGVGTGGGWKMQGFIEAADGALRPQTVEETAACIGCHSGVGAAVDGTFSFGRKTRWGAQELVGMREPVRADGRGEYRTWLESVGAGDDFASNDEVTAAFFAPDGSLRPRARAFANDISRLIVPSASRALALDRAYLALVRAQSFARGRDVFVGRPQIEERLEQGASTGVTEPQSPPWFTATGSRTPDRSAATRR
ncbi:hypothetical protein BH11MYX3_BH11MYX3_28890 [soil metagenome]